jgi:hypothetical protein
MGNNRCNFPGCAQDAQAYDAADDDRQCEPATQHALWVVLFVTGAHLKNPDISLTKSSLVSMDKNNEAANAPLYTQSMMRVKELSELTFQGSLNLDAETYPV